MKPRQKNLDCIRGFAVLWVLVVHISLNYGNLKFGVCSEGVNVFTLLSFYMVPFYIISGYFFRANKAFTQFALNKAKKLLIPYMTFSFFGLILFEIFSFITKGEFVLPNYKSFIPTATLPSNTPCWFFVSLFFVNLTYFFVSKRNNLQKNIFICVCFVFAFVSNGKMQFLGYGNIFLGLVYFHIGTLFKEYETIVRKKSIVLASLAIYMIISIIDPQRLSFVLNLQVCGYYVLNLFFQFRQ